MIWHRLDDEEHWPPLNQSVVVCGVNSQGGAQLCLATRKPFKAGGWRWRTADEDAHWTFLPHELWAPIELPDPLPRAPDSETPNG